MIFSFNKKGVELAIGTLVIISIAVLVVFVLVGYFLGAFGRSGGALSQIIGQGVKGVSGINLEQSCQGGSQCSGISGQAACEQTQGCYWGFGQSTGAGSEEGSGQGKGGGAAAGSSSG